MSSSNKKSSQKESERRQEPRFVTHIESFLKQKEIDIYTTIINLSENGAGFLSAKPFQKGEIVNINISFHHQISAPITFKVHVQSCQEVDLEYYIGGIIINKTDEFDKLYATIPHVY